MVRSQESGNEVENVLVKACFAKVAARTSEEDSALFRATVPVRRDGVAVPDDLAVDAQR